MPDLTDILQDLPRMEASPEFTSRLLVRVGLRPHRSRAGRWMAAAAAIALVVTGLAHREYHERQMHQLRVEQRALAAEVEELKKMSPEPDNGRVYLGGTDRVDYILDLKAGPAGRTSQPASTQIVTSQHVD